VSHDGLALASPFSPLFTAANFGQEKFQQMKKILHSLDQLRELQEEAFQQQFRQ
jgi:hypothetical protein